MSRPVGSADVPASAVTVVGDVPQVGDAATPRPGGAALAALLLAGDGHLVTLMTATPDDRAEAELAAALPGVRIVATGPTAPGGAAGSVAAVREAPALLVIDDGRGLLEQEELRAALAEAATRVPMVWDRRPGGAPPVPGARVLTVDLTEARAAGAQGSRVIAADEAARALIAQASAEAVVVRIGAAGALLRTGSDGLPFVTGSPLEHGLDADGAEERFAASLTVAVAGGTPLPEAVLTAVGEASAFLAAGGLEAAQRPAGPARAAGRAAIAIAERVRGAGGTVVATGGCFDLLHAGHARTLAAARALGDCLVVLLNSDDSVRRLKGPERPILPEDDRVELLLALDAVDGVLVFGEDTPVDAIRRIRPDLWVKGGDYAAADLPEAAVIREWGGLAVTVPFHPGRSTTRLAAALARVG